MDGHDPGDFPDGQGRQGKRREGPGAEAGRIPAEIDGQGDAAEVAGRVFRKKEIRAAA